MLQRVFHAALRVFHAALRETFFFSRLVKGYDTPD
jgi:hypothetical protein